MESRAIGTTGIQASVIGLGCNNFGLFQDEAAATACVHAALDAGITFFDMAGEHGEGLEESLVGAALGSRRSEVTITTKFGQRELVRIEDGLPIMSEDVSRQGASRRWIMEAVEESLRRLRTDYIDIFQIHTVDPETPPEETMRALDDLVRQGKIRAAGYAVPDGSPENLAMLEHAADAAGLMGFATVQTRYNLVQRGAEEVLLPRARERAMAVLPYSPLANGLLTGKYSKEGPYPAGSRFEKLRGVGRRYTNAEWEKLEVIAEFARVRGMTMTELAILWLLGEPLVASVIAGATSPEQVAANARAAEKRLSAEDRTALSQLVG